METQTYDELKFAEAADKVGPYLETLNDLLASGRVTLKSQKYRIENNHLTIRDQEKKIAEHQVLIDKANKRATEIISVAEDKAREVETNVKMRVIQINSMEKEAREKMEKAEKMLWQAEDKKKVKV